MMFKFLVLVVTLCSVGAFVAPPRAPATCQRTSIHSLSMLEVKEMAGVTAPLGFFDPLGFSKGADAATVMKYRESELKHGRTAMLAVLGWLTQERFHPFFNGKLSSNPLKAFTETPPIGFVQIIAFVGLLEYAFTASAKSDGYVAGDYYGFNKLFADASSEDSERFKDFQSRELNNGRLAMFGIMGEITHAFISGEGALEMQGHMLPGSIPGI